MARVISRWPTQAALLWAVALEAPVRQIYNEHNRPGLKNIGLLLKTFWILQRPQLDCTRRPQCRAPIAAVSAITVGRAQQICSLHCFHRPKSWTRMRRARRPGRSDHRSRPAPALHRARAKCSGAAAPWRFRANAVRERCARGAFSRSAPSCSRSMARHPLRQLQS